MTKDNLVLVGKIIDIQQIPGADFIHSVTVICGKGGIWRGVCKKSDFSLGSTCTICLPDSLLPQTDEFSFMKKSNWRVKMQKFKGSPSEVLILPAKDDEKDLLPGTNLTEKYGVTKYHKPIPLHLQGIAVASFPNFVPKTDEINYQSDITLIQKLIGKPYYITEKCDGSSSTAYKYKGKFGVCSRNLELAYDKNNGYWNIVEKYDLENKLPEGYAIQWETCGPKIQTNPMELEEIDGFAFSVYNINERKYLSMQEFLEFCKDIQFPTVKVITTGACFSDNGIEYLGEGTYDCGGQREGVVIRSQDSSISFKVINLKYEK